MIQLGCSVEESWEILVEVSQRSNTRVRVVAEQMIAAVTTKNPFPTVCGITWSPRRSEGQCSNIGPA
ncbi:hypothetical protein QF037_000514 [Streptomyces canus]|uniref:ANTAR domain-containing protein n=1 Tax=Streptomyces canus TaxID=58343 RepID=UPI00278916A8|nr:ANTAR domain-containing protein [Streptomyces canus]MDQ0596169.1 hypothetical protein [Streptomyces canus]